MSDYTIQPDPERRFNGRLLFGFAHTAPATARSLWARFWSFLAALLGGSRGMEFEVVENISYRIQSGPLAGMVTTVRAGFIHDFASVPRVLWRVLPPAGLRGEPYGIAAVWHDWLYCHHAVAGTAITQKQADDIFLEIMEYVGVAPWRRRLMHRAVRWFGWIKWPKPGKPDPTEGHETTEDTESTEERRTENCIEATKRPSKQRLGWPNPSPMDHRVQVPSSPFLN